MTKTKLVIIIVLIFLIGFLLYKSNLSKAPKTITITITEEGFYPSKVVVSKGDTLVWVNFGEKLHWPASNYHPTHTLYPEDGGCLGSKFDACKGLAKGESYSFTFNVLGLWPVHDHLFPSLLMTVEVLENADSKIQKSSVYNKNTKIEDFRKFDYSEQLDFMRTLSQDSPVKAWSYLKKAFVIDGQVMGNAHEFAHIIGNESYRKSGLDGIEICDKTFAFGCFHGVTEEMLLKEGPSTIPFIETGCLKAFPPEKSQDYTGCIHGTGHGIYTWEEGDLKKSLLDCDSMNERYRQYCYDGVFMENSSQPENRVVDPKNPWKLCSGLPARYHRNCARYQSQIFLGEFGNPNSVKSVGLKCSLGPSSILRETCFLSLGFYIAQNNIGNPDKILDNCGNMPNKDGVEICIVGGATETVFQSYKDYEVSSIGLCERLGEERRSQCLNNINSMIKSSK